MNYLNDIETTELVFNIINLFKKDDYESVLKIVKDNNIDPQYSSDCISDYAALWLKEPYILDFFVKFKSIGANPIGHPSILKNCITGEKINTVKYLIDEGILEKFPDDIIYFINIAVLEQQFSIFDYLCEKIDVKKYIMMGESNPSCINRVLDESLEDMYLLLIKKNIVQPFLFTKETIDYLNSMRTTLSFKNIVVSNLLQYLNIPMKDEYLVKNNNEDINTIFNQIRYDTLDNSLTQKIIAPSQKHKI